MRSFPDGPFPTRGQREITDKINKSEVHADEMHTYRIVSYHIVFDISVLERILYSERRKRNDRRDDRISDAFTRSGKVFVEREGHRSSNGRARPVKLRKYEARERNWLVLARVFARMFIYRDTFPKIFRRRSSANGEIPDRGRVDESIVAQPRTEREETLGKVIVSRTEGSSARRGREKEKERE